MRIDVTAVNDAPSGANTSVGTLENVEDMDYQVLIDGVGDIGDESTELGPVISDQQREPVAGFVDRAHFLAQLGEIGRQDRRRDDEGA